MRGARGDGYGVSVSGGGVVSVDDLALSVRCGGVVAHLSRVVDEREAEGQLIVPLVRRVRHLGVRRLQLGVQPLVGPLGHLPKHTRTAKLA